jgi:hypothetical protein
MAKKTTKKTATKKVAAKKAVKNITAKKAPVKKTAAKKAPAKKAPAKKVAAKKVAAKKVAPQKTAKKAASSRAKSPVDKTTIVARVDVGFGNSLYLRGEGDGLSWEKGVPMDNVGPYEWTFSTTEAKGDLNFKFLINDEMWAEGDNVTVGKGGTSISSPVFSW